MNRQQMLLATVAMAVALTTQAHAQSAAEGDARQGVEDIVVTAQKREQNLQDVPVSITAITASALAANRIADMRDLSALVPNLVVRPSAGGSQLPNYTLRGIFTGGSSVGTDKGVGVYIDGVYVQSVVGSFFEAADLERIEVLKGPQGTLFGRNATGGAVSYITRNPTGEFHVRQEFSYGNYDQFRTKTHVDLPRFGPLSLAGTYLHKERKGDIRNLGAGTTWDYSYATNNLYGRLVSPRTLGDDNAESYSIAAKLDLHPDVDIVYKYDFARSDYTPDGIGVAYFPSPGSPGSTFPADASTTLPTVLQYLYGRQQADLRTPITNMRPDAVNNAFTTPGLARNFGHNLTVRWRANDQISFQNILAARKNFAENTFQLDGLGGLTDALVPGNLINPLLPAIPLIAGSSLGNGCAGGILTFRPTPTCAASNAAAVGKPFSYLTNNSYNNQTQWSDEFQININTDWFTLTAGYLHFQGEQLTTGFTGVLNTGTLRDYYGQNTPAAGTPFVIPANPGYDHGYVKLTSDAWYMQPEFHITPQFDVVLGGRITKDTKRGYEYFPDQLARPGTSPIRYRSSHFNYLLGANWRPVDGVLVYGKYSTGYISGGNLATIQFAPETARSLEFGIKADLFDRRLRTNLAVFDARYGSIQYATSGTLSGVPTALLFGTAVISSANARARGFEWENTLVPVQGLTLTANVGYLDFKFDQNTVFGGQYPNGTNCFGPSCVTLNAAGTGLAASGGFVAGSGAPGYQEFGRPKWTGSFSAQYDTPEVMMGGHLMFRADANFQSANLLTSDIAPGTTSVVGGRVVLAQEDPALRAAATKPFSWIVNARVALTDFQIAGTKATLAGWGRNIFNNRSIIQFVGLGPIGAVLYERARTYGVDLSIEF